MGYYVTITDSNVYIPADSLDEAYERMCALNTTHDHLKSGGSYSGGKQHARWFSWMSENYPAECSNVGEILDMLGFETSHMSDGSLSIDYYDNKTGQESLFFEAIADLIPEGSIIDWRGEDGEIVRWYFDGQTMTEKVGRVEFD